MQTKDIAATERVIPLAQKVEVSLRIITITGAKDPDELIQKDVGLWTSAIERAVYATDWLIENYKGQLDLKSAAGKTAFTDALLPTIRRLRDPVEQEHYLKLIAEETQTSLEAVKAKLQNRPLGLIETRLKKPKVAFGPTNRAALEYQRLQDHLLAMMLLQPKLRDLIRDSNEKFFTEGPARGLLKFLQDNPNFTGDPKLSAPLQIIGDYVKIIMLQFEEIYQNLSPEDLREQAINLKRRLMDRYVKIQKHKLAQAMDAASSEEEIKKLVQKADKLNELIK